jgi:LuxR family maltose regulon positive regulatory protein
LATEAAALLALVHALEGRLPIARCLAARADVVDGCSAAARTAGALAVALCDAQGSRPIAASTAVASLDPGAVAPSRVLRVVARVLHAATPARSAPVVGLEPGVVRHPAAERTLLALGVLEVHDAAGTPVLLGGPAEAALREARRAGRIELRDPMAAFPRAHPRTAIELLALVAVSDAGDGALTHLREALALASSSGVRAPLAAPSPQLARLLGAVASEGGPQQSTAVELLDGVSPRNEPVFVEPLTEQEWVVLRFLPTMMSNQEIAAAMHLSVNTVKTHVKAVYRKLGVERRRSAVVRARQLELL